MGVNKVVYGTTTIIDISDSTVTPDTLINGSTAYGANGEPVNGTNPYELNATNEKVTTQADLIAQIQAALVGKTAGGGGVTNVVDVYTVESTPTSNSLSISFTGLSGEPTMFSVTPIENITVGTTRFIVGIEFDGEVVKVSYAYGSSSYGNRYVYYNSTYVKYTYSNGTLTLTSQSASTSGYFCNGITYKLTYLTADIVEGEGGSVAPTLQEKTVTPTASQQTITPDANYGGLSKVVINGDSDLVASNIKSGVNIFGVTGTYTGSGSSGGITPTGTITITENGTHDVTNYATAVVNVPTGGGSSGGGSFPSNPTAGDTPILMPSSPCKAVSNESLSNTNLSITLPGNGTYRIKYGGCGSYSGGRVALYDGSSQIANSSKTLGEEATSSYSVDYTVSDGKTHTIYLYGQTNNDRHPIGAFGPIACINWDNGA